MLVRIIKDWSSPDLMRQTPSGSGVWNGIRFTEEKVAECDLLVVLNAPPYALNIKCPEGRKWLLAQESPLPLYEWHKRSYPYFDRVYSFWEGPDAGKKFEGQTSLPWHVNKSYDELLEITESGLGGKTDSISWVTSNATNKPGHSTRMDFLAHMKQRGFPLALFGKGFSAINDKWEGLFPYKYSLAIENYCCRDYWTEKIADCFLSWTMPVYYGCTNILDYFPAESMLIIDPRNGEEALNKINAAMEAGRWEKNLSAIKEARDLVLNKYQFFPSIAEKLSGTRMGKRKWTYIPANPRSGNLSSKNAIFNNWLNKLRNLNA